MSSLVAVTGADGFIGSHLVEALVARGHRVRAMAQYTSTGSWGWLDHLSPDVAAEVEVVPSDVRDSGAVVSFCRDAEVVFHLAALIAIPYSYLAPRSYVDTNIGGTLNVLEAARVLGTPRVVVTSTSETYGTARFVPITEDHPLQGQSPYSATKIGADKLTESYHRSFGLPVVTLRPFNTFGPRQSARAVIPTVISQVASGMTQVHLGDVRPTRDFTFVVDTAQAFVSVGLAPAEAVVGRTFNAGTGSEISVGDLVTTIGEVMGRRVSVVTDHARLRPPDSEVQRLVCSSDRLRAATGWAPRHDLRSGLARTVEWFADPVNLAGYRPELYTV